MNSLICKFAVLLISGFFSSLSAFAQHPAQDNPVHDKDFTLFIGTAMSRISEPRLQGGYEIYSPFILPRVGIQKTWNKNWETTISIAKWKFFGNEFFGSTLFYQVPPDLSQIKGSLWRRRKYVFIDFTIGYKLLHHHPHELSVSAGPSYTWGSNSYIYYYYVNPEPPRDVVIYAAPKKMSYMGILGAINYSYTFWKERLRAGAFLAGRFYPGLKSKQVDLGVLLGYNF